MAGGLGGGRRPYALAAADGNPAGLRLPDMKRVRLLKQQSDLLEYLG